MGPCDSNNKDSVTGEAASPLIPTPSCEAGTSIISMLGMGKLRQGEARKTVSLQVAEPGWGSCCLTLLDSTLSCLPGLTPISPYCPCGSQSLWSIFLDTKKKEGANSSRDRLKSFIIDLRTGPSSTFPAPWEDERPAVREWALPLNQSFVTEIIYLPAFGARQFDNSGVEMVMTTGPAREEASESDGRFNRN